MAGGGTGIWVAFILKGMGSFMGLGEPGKYLLKEWWREPGPVQELSGPGSRPYQLQGGNKGQTLH